MKIIDYNKLRNYVLPGKDPKEVFRTATVSALIWVVFSNITGFFTRFCQAVNVVQSQNEEDIFIDIFGIIKNVDGQLVMPGFMELSTLSFWGVGIYCVYRIIRATMDMTYFTKETKSIYLIKRLGERAPVFKRCWTRAIWGIVVARIFSWIMFGIDYLVYISFTPKLGLS